MLPKRTCNYCGTEIFLNDNYVIFSDKDNKSTCINSDMSTSTKKENTFQNKLNSINDLNTISDNKKYSLIQKDSRNSKNSSNENSNIFNTDIKYNTINLSEEKNPFDQSFKIKWSEILLKIKERKEILLKLKLYVYMCYIGFFSSSFIQIIEICISLRCTA